MKMDDRTEKQKFFIRVCRDSGFKLDAINAAGIAAQAIGCSPLQIWVAVGSLDTMDAIASGNHPAAHAL
jgi:hypothetical protein